MAIFKWEKGFFEETMELGFWGGESHYAVKEKKGTISVYSKAVGGYDYDPELEGEYTPEEFETYLAEVKAAREAKEARRAEALSKAPTQEEAPGDEAEATEEDNVVGDEPTIVNLCPHPITLNSGRTIHPCGQVARVKTTYTEPQGSLGLMEVQFGEIEGLPNPQPGTIWIVSGLVLQAAKAQGRTDCIAPATEHPEAKRNDKGQIISVPGFVR